MDFSQVKSITIPEGDVAKIEIGGVTVWEKQSQPQSEWGTLWYGSSDDQSTWASVDLTQSEYESSLTEYSGDYVIGGIAIPRTSVRKFAFGSRCTSTGQNFLRNCANIEALEDTASLVSIGGYFLWGSGQKLSTVSFPNVISIGGYFLNGNSGIFNGTIDIPSVQSIGEAFLASNYNFNKPLTLPSSLRTIGNLFLSECHSFNQPLTVPSSVTSIGRVFMYNCKAYTSTLTILSSALPGDYTDSNPFTLGTNDNTAAVYVAGVTITGGQAQTWKNAFPDKSTSYYRKLILV